MHDPKTVAFEIRSPIKRKSQFFPEGYAESIITIWHNDPESDGSDDSCGWFTPPIDKLLLKEARELGEKEFDFLIGKHGWKMTPFELVFNTWKILKWRMFKEQHLSTRELEQIVSLSANPMDNIRYITKNIDAECLGDLFVIVYKCIVRLKRPWYKKPRWHFWHWEFQIHFLQTFKRWAFSRCCECGKRFTWRYSPIGYSWNSKGPSWFGEKNVAHHECDKSRRSVTPTRDTTT